MMPTRARECVEKSMRGRVQRQAGATTLQLVTDAGEDIRRMVCAARDDRPWGTLRRAVECVRSSHTTWPITLVRLATHNGSLRRIALRLLAVDAALTGAASRDEAELFRRETVLDTRIDVLQSRCATGCASRAERAALAEAFVEYAVLCQAYAELEAEIVHAPAVPMSSAA